MHPEEEIANDLRHGLFNVSTGHQVFLAPAAQGYGGRMRVRYDPGCMSPADGRARRVMEFLEAAVTLAIPFPWDTPNTVLALNNRRMLHAREDASGEPERLIERAALRVTPEAP